MQLHPWLGQLDTQIYVANIKHIDTDAQFADFVAAVEQLTAAQKEPYAWIANLGPLLNASATQRRMFADADKRMAPKDAQLCAGLAIFAPSPIARGFVTAVYWLSPPAYPMRVVSSFDEGVEFARAQLAGPIGAVG
ncbi:MAG: hypothetical protein H6718_07415 [Polyangiaceae bacterium]|nr:hypothetical protein [Myxococcales bacterium]MCB9585209.1 hypothetical protein [Polyangiaceae bacterium]